MLDGLKAAEIDLVTAIYQIFLKELRAVANDEEYDAICGIVELFFENSAAWVDAGAAYYEIEKRYVKGIFQRIHLTGSNRPDPASNSPRAGDVLPCILELQHSLAEGHLLKYKSISRLASVQ